MVIKLINKSTWKLFILGSIEYFNEFLMLLQIIYLNAGIGYAIAGHSKLKLLLEDLVNQLWLSFSSNLGATLPIGSKVN